MVKIIENGFHYGKWLTLWKMVNILENGFHYGKWLPVPLSKMVSMIMENGFHDYGKWFP